MDKIPHVVLSKQSQRIGHQNPKRETMPIEEATCDKIKDQVITKQKLGCGEIIEMGRCIANISLALPRGAPL